MVLWILKTTIKTWINPKHHTIVKTHSSFPLNLFNTHRRQTEDTEDTHPYSKKIQINTQNNVGVNHLGRGWGPFNLSTHLGLSLHLHRTSLHSGQTGRSLTCAWIPPSDSSRHLHKQVWDQSLTICRSTTDASVQVHWEMCQAAGACFMWPPSLSTWCLFLWARWWKSKRAR